MGTKWQHLDLDIPDDLDATQRKHLADLVIETIVDRTKGGVDRNGDPFPGYSLSYIKSLDFRNAGKSARDVNLTLSGDMLASLDLLDQTDGFIRIGFEPGSPENARADGNIRGTYGGRAKRSRRRDFLGIDPDELDILIDDVRSE